MHQMLDVFAPLTHAFEKIKVAHGTVGLERESRVTSMRHDSHVGRGHRLLRVSIRTCYQSVSLFLCWICLRSAPPPFLDFPNGAFLCFVVLCCGVLVYFRDVLCFYF